MATKPKKFDRGGVADGPAISAAESLRRQRNAQIGLLNNQSPDYIDQKRAILDATDPGIRSAKFASSEQRKIADNALKQSNQAIGNRGVRKSMGLVGQEKPFAVGRPVLSQPPAPSRPISQLPVTTPTTPAAGGNLFVSKPVAQQPAAGIAANPVKPAVTPLPAPAMKRGGSVKGQSKSGFSYGGSLAKASKRGDGIAQRGKTKGRMV